MNFDLSDEQLLLQQTLHDLLARECDPGRLLEIFDDDAPFDTGLWKRLVELGIAGIALPEEHGGSGLTLLDLAVAAESLGYGAAPGPFLGHTLASLAIAWAGSDDQKRRWLPALANGESLATVAWSEGDEIWQPEEWRLAGGTTLDGEKYAVPLASCADLFVVGLAGGGLALVERAAPGVEVVAYDALDRSRRVETVRFAGAAIETLPNGGEAATRVRDVGCVLLAADACGGARRAVEMSVEYAKTREQFGVTIGHFQALKHQLADMAVAAEPIQALYWYAAHALDAIPDEAPVAAALAKSHATQVYVDVTRRAVEAHGGIGYTWEGPVHVWLKRAMFDYAWLGSPRLHRRRAAALQGW